MGHAGQGEGEIPERQHRGNNRVVFNIKGNDYRLVVRINYALSCYIRFVGTHAEYDPIDVEEV